MTDSQETPATPQTPETPAPETPAAEEAPATPGKPVIEFDDFMKLDLRVATITEAEPIVKSKKLLKLQLDVGELGQRQILAGIKQFVEDASTLVGRQIIIVANLAPRPMMGEISHGMLMAASHMDGETLQDVVLLSTSNPVPAGSTVG